MFFARRSAFALSSDHKPTRASERARVEGAGGVVKQKMVTVQPGACCFWAPARQVHAGPHRVYPGGLAVARTLGDVKSKQRRFGGLPGTVIATPELSLYALAHGDAFLLLASDGVWDNVKLNRACFAPCNAHLRDRAAMLRAGFDESPGAHRHAPVTDGAGAWRALATSAAEGLVCHAIGKSRNRAHQDNTSAVCVALHAGFEKQKDAVASFLKKRASSQPRSVGAEEKDGGGGGGSK